MKLSTEAVALAREHSVGQVVSEAQFSRALRLVEDGHVLLCNDVVICESGSTPGKLYTFTCGSRCSCEWACRGKHCCHMLAGEMLFIQSCLLTDSIPLFVEVVDAPATTGLTRLQELYN